MTRTGEKRKTSWIILNIIASDLKANPFFIEFDSVFSAHSLERRGLWAVNAPFVRLARVSFASLCPYEATHLIHAERWCRWSSQVFRLSWADCCFRIRATGWAINAFEVFSTPSDVGCITTSYTIWMTPRQTCTWQRFSLIKKPTKRTRSETKRRINKTRNEKWMDDKENDVLLGSVQRFFSCADEAHCWPEPSFAWGWVRNEGCGWNISEQNNDISCLHRGGGPLWLVHLLDG